MPALPVDPVEVPPSWSGLPADEASQILVDLTLRSLLRPGEGGWVPDLAASYEVDAKKHTVVVRLDGSAVWSDGSPVLGADVAATFAAARKDERSPFHEAAMALADPGGISVAEDGSVHLLFRPDAALGPAFTRLATMAVAPAEGMSIDPESGVQKSSGIAAARENGDGSISLGANPRGGGGDLVELARFVPLPEGADSRALGRELDVGPVTPEGWESLQESHAGLQLLKRPLGSVALLVLNARPRVGAPVLGPAARAGLADALDATAILAAAGPAALPDVLPLPVLGSGEASLQAALAARARGSGDAGAELDEAGWKRGEDGRRVLDGEPVALHLLYVAGDDAEARAAEAVARSWRGEGLDVSLEALPERDFAARVFLDHSFDAAIMLWQPGDPFDPAPLFLGGSRFNASGWSSAASDTALRAASESPDWKARLSALAAWWQEAGPANAYVPLYAPATLFVARPDLEGVEPSPDLGLLKWRVGSR